MERGVWVLFAVSFVLIVISIFVTIEVVEKKYNPLEGDVALIKSEYTTEDRVFNILRDCERTAIYVNPLDSYWNENSHPTGNSLCGSQGQVCIASLLTNVIVDQGPAPREWGENKDSGLWACDMDATSVYGRSSWNMYRLDALCCAV
ncbi:MAG: hypothetical protein KKB31_01995 [Nanoarchaeota archaeon]|nr:hypothetical protein [Nanoarchaeota archaeon]